MSEWSRRVAFISQMEYQQKKRYIDVLWRYLQSWCRARVKEIVQKNKFGSRTYFRVSSKLTYTRRADCRDTNRLFRRWCALSGFPGDEPYDEVPDKRFCRQVYERRMKKSFGPRISFVVRLARRQGSKSRRDWFMTDSSFCTSRAASRYSLSGCRWFILLILELAKIYLITSSPARARSTGF